MWSLLLHTIVVQLVWCHLPESASWLHHNTNAVDVKQWATARQPKLTFFGVWESRTTADPSGMTLSLWLILYVTIYLECDVSKKTQRLENHVWLFCQPTSDTEHHFVSRPLLLSLVTSAVLPQLDCSCVTSATLPTHLLKLLQSVLNADAHKVSSARKYNHVTLQYELCWWWMLLPIEYKRQRSSRIPPGGPLQWSSLTHDGTDGSSDTEHHFVSRPVLLSLVTSAVLPQLDCSCATSAALPTHLLKTVTVCAQRWCT